MHTVQVIVAADPYLGVPCCRLSNRYSSLVGWLVGGEVSRCTDGTSAPITRVFVMQYVVQVAVVTFVIE